MLHRHMPDRCLLRLRELRALARERGGRCLSREYVTRQTPMEFRCRKGHVWKARPATILTGHWCPKCCHVPEDGLARMKALARERGGRCLSREYIVKKPGMRWRCAEGHEWSKPPAMIRAGNWCPFCAGRKTIADMQALAARHGGRCLSRTMAEGAHDAPMQWECARGHRFAVRWRCVRDGQWCQECRKADSTWMRALARAESLGGACLVDGTHRAAESVPWRCAEGHEFTTSAYRLTRGVWCPRCSGRHVGIEDMQALAERRGGRCLSRKYVNGTTKLRWECAEGHRWWATPLGVRQRKWWCPRCAIVNRKPAVRVRTTPTIWQRAQAQVEARGGACLDAVDNPVPTQSLRWRCAEGHEWRTSAYRIASGGWCLRCAGYRLGIEDMRATAAERGGRCVSKNYVDAQTKLQWECEEGHRWWARPTVVRSAGTWCPHCAWDRNAERMRSEAKDRR